MSRRIKISERTSKLRKSRREIKYGGQLERCPHEGCTHLNSPNAAYCYSCGGRLYGLEPHEEATGHE